MVSRRDLKSHHENAVLDCFGVYLDAIGSSFKILDKPDPPEAIVEINGQKTWVEVTDAFLDKAHAESLTSGAADDITHIPDDNRLIVEPDETFSNTLKDVIEKKYKKASMQTIAAANGPGILLVGVFTPFNKASAIALEEKENIESLIAQQAVKVFESIYVYDGTGKREFHLIYPA